MQDIRVRLVAVLAELLGVAAGVLLLLGTLQENWRMSVWGIAAVGGAATAAMCATIMCATAKVMRQRARHQMSTEIDEFLRGQG